MDKLFIQEESQEQQKLKNISFDELEQIIQNPLVCPQCSHPQNIRCIKCLNWWKQKCLQEAGISEMQYNQWKLNEQINQQQSQSNIHTIKDIKKQTITQLYISEQDEKYLPINKVTLTQYAYNILSDFFSKTKFQTEAIFLLFGKVNDKEALIHFTIPLYFVNLYGTSIIQYDQVYDQIYSKIIQTIKIMYDWDLLGIASIQKSKQFEVQKILYALKKHSRLFMLIYLCNHEIASQMEKQLKEKYLNKDQKKENQTMTLYIKKEYNDQFTRPYIIDDQLQFLYNNGVIDKQQSLGSIFKFKQKQAIDNQYKDELESDLFLIPLNIPTTINQVNSKIYLSYTHLFELIKTFDEKLDLENQLIKKYRSKQKGNEFKIIAELIQKNGQNILTDPLFIVFFMLSGGRCESLTTMKQNIIEYLKND